MWYQIILNVQKWPKYWDFQSFFQYLVKPNVIVWSSSMSADVLKPIHWSSFQNFWKRLNNIPQVIQWVPGKIVHDLIGSSMTYKSFCLFQCIDLRLSERFFSQIDNFRLNNSGWLNSTLNLKNIRLFFESKNLCSLGSCDHIQYFQGLCKPKINKKQSQKQSRIFKKQRKIQRKMKVFIKNTEKSFLQLYWQYNST